MSALPYLRHKTAAAVFFGGRYGMFRQTRNSPLQVGLPACVRQSEYSRRGFRSGAPVCAHAISGPTMFPRDVSATASFRLTSVPRGSCQLILLFKRVIWSDPVVNLSIKSVPPVSSSLVSSSFPYPPCLSLFKSSTSSWGSSLSGLSRK
jgi:hypothetical protein